MRRRPQDRLSSFVDDLLEGKRPRRFRATADEVEALMGAAQLAELPAGAGGIGLGRGDASWPRMLPRVRSHSPWISASTLRCA